jgi:hypothetical protein
LKLQHDFLSSAAAPPGCPFQRSDFDPLAIVNNVFKQAWESIALERMDWDEPPGCIEVGTA